MPTINEVQVKNLAKNIKLLVDSNKSIKLSQAQEIIARQLGYKDYNALASYFKQQTPSLDSRHSYVKIGIENFALKPGDIEQMREVEYPSAPISKLLTRIGVFKDYEMLIGYEYSSNNDNNVPYLLIRKKDSWTQRVLYSPFYETFSFFVYPNLQNPIEDYHVNIRGVALDGFDAHILSIVQHITEKEWMRNELMSEFVSLAHFVKKNRKEIDALKYLHQENLTSLLQAYKEINMNVDIYRINNSNNYVAVPSGIDINAIQIKETGSLRNPKLFKENIMLDLNQPRIAMDQEKVLEDIKKDGYALFGTKIEFSEPV